jgi:predicted acyltransferase
MSEELKPTRLLSLDVFRGLTIAGMVLVNNPGPSGASFSQLNHAEWHGWTPTDFIFPFFLYIVGISITLALSKRAEAGGSMQDLYWKITKRAALIYLLGFFLASFPFFKPETVDFSGGFGSDVASLWASSKDLFANVRLTGVLQRIAFCYLIAAVLFLHTKWRAQLYVAVGLCLGYWALMTLIPAPGFAAGDLSKEGNLAAWFDRVALGNHIWRGGGKIYDPEGILSTLPAIATTLSGVLTGHWLRTRKPQMEKIAGLFAIGAACVAIGWVWHWWFPFNKPLWSSSYVFYMTGLALVTLAGCVWLIDEHGYKGWTKPFEIFGVNALALFVGSGFLARCMMLWKTPRATGKPGNLIGWFYDHFFAWGYSPKIGSFLYAFCYLLLWLGIMTILYRKKIYIKV